MTRFGSTTIQYNNQGNIIDHSAIGYFSYSKNKPYAIEKVQPYTENLPQHQQDITYNAQMRPVSIAENGYKALFSYDTDGNRIKMNLMRNDTLQLNRYYVGGIYEIDETLAGTSERLYLGGDAYSAAAVYVKEASGWTVNYIGRDYLGSITHVMDQTGVVRQELSYDPWGRLRDPLTQALFELDKRLTLVLGDRGYTGHEHLSVFGLINMNARLYDPVIGRFLSPDPYVQAPDFSQNFNRYSYALNNPLRYTDPSGEWFLVDDLIAAAIGGTVNLIGNAIAGNVNSWQEGFSYFGVGALGGWVSIYASPIVGGMIIAGGNSALEQGFEKGFGNIKWDLVGNQTLFGGINGAISAGIGNYLQGPMSSVFGKVASPVLRQALIQGTTGGVTGFAVNTTVAKMNGASWDEAFSFGWNGFIWGLSTGLASGSAQGYKYATENGLSPWTGKVKQSTAATSLSYSDSQIGKKYGEHMDANMEGYRSIDEYRKLANDIYSNPNSTKVVYPSDAPLYRGETHYQLNGNLLRLDHNGNFRSLYNTNSPK